MLKFDTVKAECDSCKTEVDTKVQLRNEAMAILFQSGWSVWHMAAEGTCQLERFFCKECSPVVREQFDLLGNMTRQ